MIRLFGSADGFNTEAPARLPAEVRSIPISFIADINAQQFLPSVVMYLRMHGSHFVPQPFHRFDLYKRINIALPSIREHGERAYQDFALVPTGESNVVTDGTTLEGLLVAQVRVLFKFPAYTAQTSRRRTAIYLWSVAPLGSSWEDRP
ncbi:hypothetical protein B0H14DRAFT_3526933 [Mycena olivaceomarginata]|nr:hypothetical protein B0H14DRAFT_3526933 [Mycena olivaceomarginata]